MYLKDQQLYHLATRMDYSVNNTLQFLDNFGVEKLYEDHTFVFGGIRVGSYINSFIGNRIRMKHKNLEEIKLELKLLIEKGIPVDKVRKSINNITKLGSKRREKQTEELNEFLDTFN